MLWDTVAEDLEDQSTKPSFHPTRIVDEFKATQQTKKVV